MDVDRFKASPIGELTPIEVLDGEDRIRHFAYIPAPLPATVPLTNQNILSLETATLALGRLDGEARRLPNPLLLARPALRREAVSSSSLEGTVSTLSDVFASELIDDPNLDLATTEVRNFVRAAELGILRLKTLPVSVRLLCELHATLLTGVRGDSYHIGALRNTQNWIGSPGSRVDESTFVPPPPGVILSEGLSAWEKWLHQATGVPLLVRVALGHYQLETLHPFDDGNGRLGRLAILLSLIEEEALTVPLLDVSTWLEARRTPYIDRLRQVSETGDFSPWIDFFLNCLREQSDAARNKASQLIECGESMVARLRAENVRGSAVDIARSLIGQPVLTVRSAATLTEKTYQAASDAVSRLLELGILAPWPRERYPRIYWAPEVYDIIQR